MSRYIASVCASKNLRCTFDVTHRAAVSTLRLREWKSASTSTSALSTSSAPSRAAAGSNSKIAALSRPRLDAT